MAEARLRRKPKPDHSQEYSFSEQCQLHTIAMAAQMKRKRECALRKKRKKEHKHVNSLILQKGILERILETSRREELMKSESFEYLMTEAIHMMSRKRFDVLHAQSWEERSQTHPELGPNSSPVARVKALLQTKSYQQLMRSASKELMKTKIFKELVPLKSVEEVIKYDQSIVEREEKESLAIKPDKPAKPNDEKLLRKLFGKDLDQNEMILSIITAMEEGELIIRNPEPKYFDGLCYVLDTYTYLSENLRKLEVVLDRPHRDFSDNIYGMASVLGSMIEEALDLRSLTLQGFAPSFLADIVGGILVDHTRLKVLNLEHNHLKTFDAVRALYGMPQVDKGALLIKLAHNRVDDQPRIRRMLSLQKGNFSLEF